MAKVSLEVPNSFHFKLKRKQLDLQVSGQKVNLNDLYVELIRKGVEQEAALKALDSK